MEVLILAGGKGTRIVEKTKSIPKPLINIDNIPIIVHIMITYAIYGYKNFIIAGGYKHNLIKKYFNIEFPQSKKKLLTKYQKLNPNIFENWKIRVINTGLNTLTGGRILRIKKYIKNEVFFLTYGDGLSNVNINKLLEFHNKINKKPIITLTAVRPPARYGSLFIDDKNLILNFKEKDRMTEGWINGGYMVCDYRIFKYIKGDNSILEKNILEKLSVKGDLLAFKHPDFWQSMDTMREHQILSNLIKKKKIPWINLYNNYE